MSRVKFGKWQGTGNDFILVDDRTGGVPSADMDSIRKLCDRHFGVGSDGLVLIQAPKAAGTAYHMEFFNPDGSGSFCGNGSRCAFAFFDRLTGGPATEGRLPHEPVRFTAIDGEHEAAWSGRTVTIGMRDVAAPERMSADIDRIHTGSPHLLIWVKDPEAIDILAEGRRHRYSPRFEKEGINVNFLRWKDGRVEMRTYERGVEAETLSCGTGVTAAALSAMARGLVAGVCAVRTRGGNLRVEARSTNDGGFQAESLAGPVQEVFSGEVEIRS